MNRYDNISEQKFFEFALLSLVAQPRLAKNGCVAWLPMQNGTVKYTDVLITDEREFKSNSNFVGIEMHPVVEYFKRQIIDVDKLVKLTNCKIDYIENTINNSNNTFELAAIDNK